MRECQSYCWDSVGILMRDSYVNGALLALAAPETLIVSRQHGYGSGCRFALGMTGTLLAQQSLVGWARRRVPGQPIRNLTAVDLLTLSRGVPAATLVGLAVTGVRDRLGTTGWLAWLSVLYGAIACDWLDGPIARHRETTKLGEILDLEADSWLTLCMAGASVIQGGMPMMVVIPPLLRYGVLIYELQRRPYADIFEQGPGWSRHLGMAQAMLFIGALAPFGGPLTRRIVRAVEPIQTPIQAWSVLRSRSPYRET